jgi:hypothetical protein
MDEGSSLSDHRFASWRTCCEGLKVVVKYTRDLVDELSGQTYTPVLDRSANPVEVDMRRDADEGSEYPQ